MEWVKPICSDVQNSVLCWSEFISTHILENLENGSYKLQCSSMSFLIFFSDELSWLFGSINRHGPGVKHFMPTKYMPTLRLQENADFEVDCLLLQTEAPKNTGLKGAIQAYE